MRFEVIGDLWGTLATSVFVRVCDASTGGLLVEVPRALPPGFAYQVRLAVRGESVVIPVRVSHRRRIDEPDGAERHLVGLEFVHVPPAAAEWLEDLCRVQSTPAGPEAAPEAKV